MLTATFRRNLKLRCPHRSGGGLQFRVKDIDQHEAARLALPLQEICARHDVAFIVNDSIALAKRIKADGVHLGQDDGDPREARGSSAAMHRSASLATTAAIWRWKLPRPGRIMSRLVPISDHDQGGEAQADLETLEMWSQFTEVPCVAIGGITPDNAKAVIDAGADFIAVSGAVWNHPEGSAAAVKPLTRCLLQSQP